LSTKNMEQDVSWFKSLLYASDEECLFDTDELVSMALTYPPILVACADGIMDNEERVVLATMARALGESDGDELTEELKYLERYASFVKLATINDADKSRLLELLGAHCSKDPEVSTLILNSIYNIAEASNGISSEEQNVIDEIKLKLNIAIN